jgi:hypothetical protein
MGEALERMRRRAFVNGLRMPTWTEADPFDRATLPEDAVADPSGECFWSNVRHAYPAEPPRTGLPYGIVGSCVQGPFDVADVRPGYRIARDGDVLTAEVNVDSKDLVAHYGHLLRWLEPLAAFWYDLHEHWEDSPGLLLVTERLTSASAIVDHLTLNAADSVRNGFVSITAYRRDGAVNLGISDHKTIRLSTRSAETMLDVERQLCALGYALIPDLVLISGPVYHWHFRDPAGSDRANLVDRLGRIGFREWHPRAAG